MGVTRISTTVSVAAKKQDGDKQKSAPNTQGKQTHTTIAVSSGIGTTVSVTAKNPGDGKKPEETTVSTQDQETDTTIAAIDTTVSVTAKTQDDKENEESAASKEDGETGTVIAVSAGIGVFVVIVIIGVAVGMFLVRRKKMIAVAPHLHNTGVPRKITPSFKKRETIELTEVNTQTGKQVVVEVEGVSKPEGPGSMRQNM